MDELEQKVYIFASIFALANKLQVLGDTFDKNITIKQWLFIVSVSKFDDPPTLSEVANFIGYSSQNAKRIAVVLNERGYITIIKDQDDARTLRISLTQKCTDYFTQRTQKELQNMADEVTALLPVTKKEKQVWVFTAVTAGITEELLYRGFFFYLMGEILLLFYFIVMCDKVFRTEH
ncbi:MAG: hypothetical protein PHO29_13660 [Acetobacterium sp.]|nr:hypothetical protein [Acetobacterium sp.]